MTKSELLQYLQQMAQKQVTELNLCFEELTELPPEIGQLTQLQSLDLSFNQLTQFPIEITQLTQLQELFLNDNQLTQLPADIGRLTQLQELVLSGNRLTHLPAQLGLLTSLQWLDLNGNRLTELPPQLGQLTLLQRLHLGNNQLTTLPATIGQLTLLQHLDLSDNQLTHLPPEIGQLTLLQQLHLSHNQLTHLPSEIKHLIQLQVLNLHDNRLTQLPLEISTLAKFMEANINPLPMADRYEWSGLQLQDNPLRMTMPPEMLEKKHRPTEITNYYFNLRHATPLHEAKLLVVGQSGVGKTSLVNRLLHQTYNHFEPPTEGIAITRWSITTPKDELIHLTVWDFGGQEIMPVTHQFFLTKRSLYVLVLDAQLGETANRVEYWLKLIHNVGGDSPVLVAINKSEDGWLDLNRQGLMNKYPALKAFIDISCQNHQDLETVHRQIAEWVDKLEHVHDPFPIAWCTLKDQLGNLSRDYLSYDDYVQMCEQDYLMDTISQRTLIGFLHDLGIILNFREDPQYETHIFKPVWVAQGVYKLLNSKALLHHNGVLVLSQLQELLASPRYPLPKPLLIVEIMKKFELGLALEARSQFLIPELLPKAQPADLPPWDFQNSLAFQYHYEILPSGIISRVMVRLQSLIYPNWYWHTGVVLTKDDSQALVTADLEDHKIFIWVTGSQGGKPALLTIIRSHFDYIHQSIPKLKVTAQVPYKTIVIPHRNLLKFIEKGMETLYVPEVDEVVDLVKLLDDLDEPGIPNKKFEESLVASPQEKRQNNNRPESKLASQSVVPAVVNLTWGNWPWPGIVGLLVTIIMTTMLYYSFSANGLWTPLSLGMMGGLVVVWMIYYFQSRSRKNRVS